MAIDPHALNAMIDSELQKLSDHRVCAHVRSLRVEPTPVMRAWDYGRVGEQYPCWTVLEHLASNTGIAYCEHGFGPRSPWGLVFLEGDDQRKSIGMDCSWYTTFMQAFFESQAAIGLSIWRVFKTDPGGKRLPISNEGGWDETWSKVKALREADPTARYDCWTWIPYDRE